MDKNDKYSKIRPLLDHLEEKFIQHVVPSQKISNDEAMMQCIGQYSCKQAIRNKPFRFGYKVWSQNTSNGYLITFDVYQGKTYQGDEEMELKLGKAPATVMHLLVKHKEKSDLPYHIFMDNLFTTVPLLKEMDMNGYLASGTVRVNMLRRSCSLANINDFKRSERGSMRSVQTTISSLQKKLV